MSLIVKIKSPLPPFSKGGETLAEDQRSSVKNYTYWVDRDRPVG